VIVPARRGPRRVTRWIVIGAISLGVLGAVVAGGLLAVRYWWPEAVFHTSAPALTRVSIAPAGERVVSVRAHDGYGHPVTVRVHDGRITPVSTLPGRTRVFVRVTVERSSWVGWLVGRTEVVHTVIRTPAAALTARFYYPKPGSPVKVRFNEPVRVISVREAGGTAKTITLPRAESLVPIGVSSSGADAAGTAFVAGAARSWEQLPSPVRVNWFPGDAAPKVLVRPAPKTKLSPSSPIVLTFSRPVTAVLGSAKPRIVPHTRGTWSMPNNHTLVFQPSGIGFPLGRRVHLLLPSAIQVIAGSDPATYKKLTWQVPRASLLRTKQLLAQLGYLPLNWQPSADAVRMTLSAQARAAINPPAGNFVWRYANTPQALKEIWTTGSLRPTLVRGAIMAFENEHEMSVDGYPSMALFRALVRAELNGHTATGYSYVYVSETLPETLTLWHNGHVVLRTPVNTGIASRPTALGTFPVYSHLTSTTMSGTNPDGTHYNDSGVPWVNYFTGGDAVHGFYRGGYGWPQSLGCVEVPVPTAGVIFPYINIGTLVTVVA
jgi:L,D-transpeptidase catalytic domain